jgi:hypothetical protein
MVLQFGHAAGRIFGAVESFGLRFSLIDEMEMKHTSLARLWACLLVVAVTQSCGPMPPPTYSEEDRATAAEIDAAASLDEESARVSALQAIARRPLAETAQLRLVHVTYDKLTFDNNKVALLSTLIQNRSFCSNAKQAICQNLNRLQFDSQRQQILTLINQRGTLVE